MSTWPFDEKRLKSQPWGLPADLLQPAKRITDPVHGEVRLTKLEQLLVDSPAFQRLRGVRQLGTTHLVYPGATHSRFSHALGTLKEAQELIDVVVDQRLDPHSVPDLFAEWADEGPEVYEKRIAEAVSLARVGGLLHDLGHVPFGHTVEDDLKILTPHDANQERFDLLWNLIPSEVRTHLTDEFIAELRPLILSKQQPRPELRYPFVADIVGNTICADLLDYLARDHYYTGLPAGLGRRFMIGFYVTPTTGPLAEYRQRMVIRLARDGRARADVRTELSKYLHYRYELSERALVHHAKLAADSMVGMLIDSWSRALKSDDTTTSNEAIEAELVTRSDDGLLEYLRDRAGQPGAESREWQTVGEFATALLERRLYKPIASLSNTSVAQGVFDSSGSSERRSELERSAEVFAGLDLNRVLLWIPDPNMRLKAASVLTEDKGVISPLSEASTPGARHLYDEHRNLWRAYVFIHPDVPEGARRVVRAFVAQELGGGAWDDQAGPELPPRLAATEALARLSAQPTELSNFEESATRLIKSVDTFDALVSALCDEFTTPELRASVIDVWLEGEEGVYAHRDLRYRVAELAEAGNAPTLDEVTRLNLRLHLDDLPANLDGIPEADLRAAALIEENPGAVYETAARHMATSGAAHREGGAIEPVSTNADTAIERAFIELLSREPLI